MRGFRSLSLGVLITAALPPAALGVETVTSWRETLNSPGALDFAAGTAAYGNHIVYIENVNPRDVWVADVDASSGDIVAWRQTQSPPGDATYYQNPVVIGEYLVLPGPARSYVARLAPDASVLEWRPAPGWADSMPSSRGIVALGNRIYVVGSGATGSVETATITNDGVLSEWSSLLPSPLVTDDSLATFNDGYLYHFGGENRGGGLTNAADVYRAPLRSDGTIERWEFVGRMLEWRPHSAFLQRCGLIHVVGGGVHWFLTASVESAPLSTFGISSTHVYGAPLPNVLNEHVSAVVGRWGYIMSGNSSQYGGRLRTEVRVAELPCSLPVAAAGPDQSVDEGALVTLVGSGSDPDGSSLSYSWTQVAGPAVVLSDTTSASPSFVTPAVPRDGAVLTFELVVYGASGSSAPSHVNVTIKNVNHLPVAEVGTAITVPEGGRVSLNGGNSYDPDDEPVSFAWTQIAGEPVLLEGPDGAATSFTAPFVGRDGATLVFRLVVSDGLATSAPADVSVHITNVNQPPVANAGFDQSANEAALVRLEASASDPDGDAVSFSWVQTAGPQVVLDDPFSATPTFRAPFVVSGGALLNFQLVASDGIATGAPDFVVVQVVNVNDPPSCTLAAPSTTLLWPPNHKLLPVEIVGLIDPQGDPLQILITSVTQDEPTSGTGDGDVGPDAVAQGGSVLLRAERSGIGDGRVYRIQITATDPLGESCTGAVAVSVPKNMGKNGQAVDSGQLFVSVGP